MEERKFRVRYYHPAGVFGKEKIVCHMCGVELDEKFLSEIPCSIQTANRLEVDGYVFEVMVWNCEVKLLVSVEEEWGRRRYFEIEYSSEDVKKRVDELLLSSVEKAGGSINMSGAYPLSEELVGFLVDCWEKGEIKVKS